MLLSLKSIIAVIAQFTTILYDVHDLWYNILENIKISNYSMHKVYKSWKSRISGIKRVNSAKTEE